MSSNVRHQPVAQPAVVATTRPVRCGANEPLRCSNRRSSIAESARQASCTHDRRRNQPSAVDAARASVQDLIRSSPVQWGGGRTRCYTVRGLCISTLHVSLIIRVLPCAESATGCIFRQRGYRAGAIYVQGRYFRSIRRALRGSDWRAEVRRKRFGKQVEHRACRFSSVFSTQRWWRFQAFV